jgi:hypothetical protein
MLKDLTDNSGIKMKCFHEMCAADYIVPCDSVQSDQNSLLRHKLKCSYFSLCTFVYFFFCCGVKCVQNIGSVCEHF